MPTPRRAPAFPLLLSAVPTAPINIAEGQLYMDPNAFVVRFIPQGALGSFMTSFAIPNTPGLAGLTVVAQVLDPGTGLTLPVYATAVLP